MPILPDTTTIEHLDFDHAPTCEHPHHGDPDTALHDQGPAKYYRHRRKMPCGHEAPGMYVCQRYAQTLTTGNVRIRCGGCNDGTHWEGRDLKFRFTPITPEAQP